MIDRKEYMIKKRKIPQVTLDKFYKKYNKNEHMLNIFVEGEDDITYYTPKFMCLCNNIKFQFYNSGGKENVIDIYNLLRKNENYENNKLVYIVDSDFDDPIENKDDNMYETSCYAVENFYTSIEVFKRILTCPNWFEYIEGEENYNYSIKKFKEFEEQLHDKLLLLNSWMYFQRRMELEKGQNKKLKFDKIEKDCFISISLEKGVIAKYNLDKIKTYFEEAYECDEKELEPIKQMLMEKDKQKFFRGKHELFYFIKFLNKLIESHNKSYNNKKIKKSISEKDAIEKLSSYSDFPEDLREFIENLKNVI